MMSSLPFDRYATQSEPALAFERLGKYPKVITDLDGCYTVALKVPKNKRRLLQKFGPTVPTVQDIPFGIGYQKLEELRRDGSVKHSIFANQMDVRFPLFAVTTLTDPDPAIRTQIMPLTSRPDKHVIIIAQESGILSLDNIACATEAGGKLRFYGHTEASHPANAAEQLWLAEARLVQQMFSATAARVLNDFGFQHVAPPIVCTEKPFLGGLNSDWAPLLSAAQQEDHSPLDMALQRAWSDSHRDILSRSPLLASGEPSFRARFGPRNAEVQFSDVDKGLALKRLVELDQNSPFPATGYLVAGDDLVVRGDGSLGLGTDYPAWRACQKVSERFDVPVLFVHVQHPVKMNVYGKKPDPAKSPLQLPPEQRAHVAFSVPTPYVFAEKVRELLEPAQARIRAKYNYAPSS